MKPESEPQDPLSFVIEWLEKRDELVLAEQLIDTFARYAGSIEEFNAIAKLYLDITCFAKAEQYALKDRKSTRLNSSHVKRSRMPSSA